MFAKLLKYEWKATGGLLGIFTLAAVIAGGVGAVSLRFIVRYTSAMLGPGAMDQDSSARAVAISGLSMLLLFVMLALVAYYFGTQIVLLYRFYKNKFTDEGYLTFTLPVKNHEILAASWLNMLIWMLISTLVIGAILVVMLFCATEWAEFFGEAPMDEIVSFYSDTLDYDGTNVVLTLASSLLEWLGSPLIAMTCITIGAVGAKKHKILLAIAVYYGYSVATGIVGTVISAVVAIASLEAETQTLSNLSLACDVLTQGVVDVICWFLTNYLMNHKLNLP